MKPKRCPMPRARGFTLIEMVMVIIILGVIGAMLAVFMKKPVDAYFDSGRRAALTDVADTAVRRLSRDLARALPNSARLPSGSDQCIEFMPTKVGARYRAQPDLAPGAVGSDVLDFTVADNRFNMLGDNWSLLADQQIGPGDLVAVYNLGITGADAYNGDNTDTVSAAPAPVPVASRVVGTTTYAVETQITTAGRVTPYPLASPNNRFHVIPAAEQVVSYVCSTVGMGAGGDGDGKLYRYARALVPPYLLPVSCPAIPAGTPMLAQNLSACSFVYTNVANANADLRRNGLLQVRLELTKGNETVSLYQEVHVDNTP